MAMFLRGHSLRYDADSDTAYVRLHGAGKAVDTVELEEGMFAHLDAEGKVVGLKISRFSKRDVRLNALIARGLENIQVPRAPA